nr:immunoglobulin light chain junction region [Macaca mulatta]MOV93701.1 immunoglobulin light chain junction region [Macaca mulatta]MOV94038.1 immunoglobulin light chain junction region [Macaca mulatta]
CLQDTQLPPMF